MWGSKHFVSTTLLFLAKNKDSAHSHYFKDDCRGIDVNLKFNCFVLKFWRWPLLRIEISLNFDHSRDHNADHHAIWPLTCDVQGLIPCFFCISWWSVVTIGTYSIIAKMICSFMLFRDKQCGSCCTWRVVIFKARGLISDLLLLLLFSSFEENFWWENFAV